MRRGIYSSTIALTALVLAIALIATTSERLALEEKSVYSDVLLEVKGQWQNSARVLDKAASDAIADTIVDESCAYNPDSVDNTARQYFSQTLNELWNGTCSLTSLVVSGSVDNIAVTTTISCSKYLGSEFDVRYDKKAIFSKDVDITNISPCKFTVTDIASGIVEVDY
tara:strand:- start:4066 stop:4569 length:504 start_codon:yes stop_codon:yes gene_type:complete